MKFFVQIFATWILVVDLRLENETSIVFGNRQKCLSVLKHLLTIGDIFLMKRLFNFSSAFFLSQKLFFVQVDDFLADCTMDSPWMKEARDKTWRGGGLPTLPGLNLSTIQPSQRGFFRVHTSM
jgi:hypothetical protein